MDNKNLSNQGFEDISNPMEVSFDIADIIEDKLQPVEISFDGEEDIQKSNLVINLEHDTDDDEEISKELQRLSKGENKTVKKWEKFECGGINCHGQTDCKAGDCQCSHRQQATNFLLLQSLCKHMILLNCPHRVNDPESWRSFASLYFSSKKNEIPSFLKTSNMVLEKYGGEFLRSQWIIAKTIFLESVNESKRTPFLEDCARVIEDKNDYEKQVTIQIKIYIIQKFLKICITK